jgi:hypothetical protein
MKRKEVDVYVRVEDEKTKQVFSRKIKGYAVTIKGLPLIVHPSVGYTGGRDLWNCSDGYTGMRVGPRSLGIDKALREARKVLDGMEKKNEGGKTLFAIFEQKRVELGSVLDTREG